MTTVSVSISPAEMGSDMTEAGDPSEPPDDTSEPPEISDFVDFPPDLKCPVLLFKPKLPDHSHIYSAIDNQSHRVAVKRIKIDEKSNNAKILSTIREIRALRGLEHESIVKFLDVKITSTNIFIVQELMDTDLECIMENTVLEMEHIRLFSFQLLRAVNFIHSSRVIHRDIQMSNIFINVDTLMLKIGDFGSSRVLDNRQEERVLSLPVSSRFYHAPEIVLGERNYSFPADVFSIGVIFYGMSFGINFEIGESPAEFIKFWSDKIYKMTPTGDSGWDSIIIACLQLQPNNRAAIPDLLKSPFYSMIQDGNTERTSRKQFHVEEEIFSMREIYSELETSVNSCRPDEEMLKNQLKPNSSIRSFVDVSSTCLSTVSEHEARILATDYDFGIIINEGSDKKDRMFFTDHQAELGQSFDPYKWDRKQPTKDTDSGYQSGDIGHSKVHSDLTQSNSPDISYGTLNEPDVPEEDVCGDHDLTICERDLEMEQEA
jgi:serine/threonine protein kinase